MTTDDLQPVKVVCRLPPPEKLRAFNEWGDANKPFFKETIEDLRASMESVAGFIRTNHAAACKSMSLDVVLSWEPQFNAFLDNRPKTLIDMETSCKTVASPEISINIGVPIALACLKPVLRFCGQEMATGVKSEPPNQLLVMIARLHEAWHFQSYAPAFVTSLRQDPAWSGTLTFILAHEASHHLLHAEADTGRKYRSAAQAVYRQLLDKSGYYYNARQIDHVRRLFEDPRRRAAWIEELAADILAYEICRTVDEPKGLRDLFGVTTMCVMCAAFEHYLEIEEISWEPTHPFAFARLLAFEKHLQIKLALTDTEFSKRPEWLFPMVYFKSFSRVLVNCGKSTYLSDIEWDRSFHNSEAKEQGGTSGSVGAGAASDENAASEEEVSKRPEDWIREGMALDNAEKWGEAVYCYKRALESDGGCVPAWSHRGNSLLQMGRHFQALESFEVALKLDENYAKAWVGKGDVLVKLARFDEAIEAFQWFCKCASPQLLAMVDNMEERIAELREISLLQQEAQRMGTKVHLEGIGEIGANED